MVINSLSRFSSSRVRSTTRPSLADVESTSEPVAEISNVGVTIAVKNSIVELNACGSKFTMSPEAIIVLSKINSI